MGTFIHNLFHIVMKKLLPFSIALVFTLSTAYLLSGGRLFEVQAETLSQPLPEFTQTNADAWLNSEPLSVKQLRGKVVLLDVWTLACWNCYRSFPWLRSVEDKYQPHGLRVIGIHSPEFDAEHKRKNVEKAVEKYQLHHPVMMDNDFAYWQALENRYWPAYYLIDKEGNIRYRFVGETHEGDRRAKKIAQAIEELLQE